MALQAPAHGQLADPLGHSHVVLDFSVTFLTGNPAADMTLVTEVDKVGQVVDLNPGNNLVALVIIDQLLQLWTISCVDL